MHIDQLDTPTLTVDLDALEGNLASYQAYFTRIGMGLRPHIKTHKTLAVAHMQMARGAIGLACQKLGEAEVMVNGGITQDILIPYNIIGPQKLARLVALSRQANVTVAADSAYTIAGLALAATQAGVKLQVIVEVEVGMNRTGAVPQEAVKLAQQIDLAPSLTLRGFMAYPTPPAARPIIQETIALFDQHGLSRAVVSGGGTKPALQAHELPELTEWRAGEYPMGGAGYVQSGQHTVAQCALRILATVISRPTADRAILDCGSKTLSASTLQTPKGSSMGYVVEYPDAYFYGASEEHGHVDVSLCARQPQIGERVTVLPVHPCPCVNEHDELVATRGGEVLAVWPVYARGKIR